MKRLRARLTGLRSDRGMTLVEVLVAMVVMGAVAAFVSAALVDSHKLYRVTDDQTKGLEDVKVAAERLARDVRDARSVVCNPAGTAPALAASDPTCQYHLQLWIDQNSNYKQEPTETVTWHLRSAADAGHYDFVRIVDGSEQVQARTIVKQVAFSYDRQPAASAPGPGVAQTAIVKVNMDYDAVLKSGTVTRTVTFSGRLRNVS